MRVMNSLIMLILTAFIANPTTATTRYHQTTFYCEFHFTKFSFDKSVNRVMAHAGIATIRSSYPYIDEPDYYWQDVKDTDLKYQGEKIDAFIGKRVLTARHRSGSREDTIFPIVQFWVTFDDGTEMILDEVEMEVSQRYFQMSPELKRRIKDFYINKATDHGSCFSLTQTQYGN